MKTPRVHDFDPNAKPPELGTPMNDMPIIKPPAKNPEIPKTRNQDNPNTRYQEIPKSRKGDIRKGGNPEIPTSGKPDIPKSGNKTALKVPKYYTQLPQEWQDEIKIYAVRHKLDDYEVVIQAIEEFFKKQK
jgi:hypothetical protein